MATNAEVNTLFRALFKDVGGFADNVIRPVNQNAPVGPGLFATVNITQADGAMWATRKLENDPDSVDLIETVYKDLELSLSVQFYREGAWDSLSRLVHLLQSSAGIDRMQAIGVGLQGIGQIRDLSAFSDTYTEERVQCDLTFAINAVYLVNIRAILSAVFEINFEDYTQQHFTMELNS